MASIFSKIIAGEIPGYIIDENEKFIAFLDVFPLVKGHVLVVPKMEIDYIFDLPKDVLSDYLIFAKRIAVKMRKVLPCERIGMSVIGLEVPHAHLHLVPINSADDLNFTRPKIKLEKEEFEKIAKAIREA